MSRNSEKATECSSKQTCLVQGGGLSREQEHQVRVNALRNADVVCCTCVGAGSDMVKQVGFPAVLVDEAAHTTELEVGPKP